MVAHTRSAIGAIVGNSRVIFLNALQRYLYVMHLLLYIEFLLYHW